MKLEYTLIQQTPMIHFQAKKGKCEDGLALRPSEVKPKLDRFIRLWYIKNNGKKSLPLEWYTEYDHKEEERAKKECKDYKPKHTALNYKMKIIATQANPKSVEDPRRESAYFGNMGGEKKYQVIFYPLKLSIMCMIPDLEKVIKECMETFFLVTNFGTRQDKGFGGFLVKSENEPVDYDKILMNWLPDTPIIKIDYSNKELQGNDYLREINLIYKLLKSGVNMRGDYVKSALTEYFGKEKIAGEKSAMKRSGVAPSVYDKKNEDGIYYGKIEEEKNISLKPERYIRGLFGYGEGQKWFSADINHKKMQVVKKDKNGKIVYENDKPKYIDVKNSIEIRPDGNDSLARIPSPLQFIVVDKTVYIIPMRIDERIYGKKYKFTSDFKPEYMEPKELILSIPKKEEFDLNEFMKWFGTWLNNNERRILEHNDAVFEKDDVEIKTIGLGGKDS